MNYLVRTLMILSLLLLNGCQPLEMAIPSVAGIVAYPFVKLKEAFEDNSDDFYEKTQKDKARKEKEEEALTCQRDGLPLTDEMKKILENVNLKQCVGCKPLEYTACKDASCSCSTICPDWCERLCPNNFSILKQSRELAIPYKENNIAIVNQASDFGDPVVFGGYCNGITQLTKHMTALATFKPNEKPTYPGGGEIKNPADLKKYYFNILLDLESGKVRDIPGYPDIYSFTKDPLHEQSVRDVIRQSWSDSFFYNPFLVESAGVYTNTTEDELQSSIKDMKKSIESTGSAQVTVSLDEEKGKGHGHTVEIYHIYEKTVDGEKMILGCANNSNSGRANYSTKAEWQANPVNFDPRAPDGIYCPEPMPLKKEKDGKVTYRRHTKVDNMDKRTSVDHIDAVRSKCKKDRGCD